MQTGGAKREGELKILVFDCWLPGFLYIQHLADLEGVSLTFVHNSESQLGQPAKEYEDFKSRLSQPTWVKDFSDYKKSFKCLFETVAPDIVLVTSMHYVEHRSALLFAKEYGVQRAFIPHGIFQLDRSNLPVSSSAQGGKLERLIQKIPRAIYYSSLFWSAHFQRDPVGRGSFRQALSCFKELLLRYPNWQWSPPNTVQRYYSNLLDVAIVYDNSLKAHYIENSGSIFNNTEFIISGTLDSGKLLRTLKAKPNLLLRKENSAPVAYYISSPYPDDFSEDGAKIMAGLLKQLAVVVNAAGCERLIYRAHPGEPNWFVDLVCEVSGVERDTDPGMEGLVVADLICGTSSSLLYNAILLEKPVVILISKKIKMDLPYYEPLISYPKITLDLDLDAEALVRDRSVALREILLKRPGNFQPTVSDPIEVLLEASRRASH